MENGAICLKVSALPDTASQLAIRRRLGGFGRQQTGTAAPIIHPVDPRQVTRGSPAVPGTGSQGACPWDYASRGQIRKPTARLVEDVVIGDYRRPWVRRAKGAPRAWYVRHPGGSCGTGREGPCLQ